MLAFSSHQGYYFLLLSIISLFLEFYTCIILLYLPCIPKHPYPLLASCSYYPLLPLSRPFFSFHSKYSFPFSFFFVNPLGQITADPNKRACCYALKHVKPTSEQIVRENDPPLRSCQYPIVT